MKRIIVCLYAALLGCNQQKPVLSDEQVQAFRELYPGMTESCLDKLKLGGAQGMPDRSDECFKFDKPRRGRGVWINTFEGSQFCPEPAERSCPPGGSATYDKDIWLEFARQASVQDRMKPDGVYEVEFIGRRSVGAGTFGHFGMSANGIIVDRMISMKELRSPPKG